MEIGCILFVVGGYAVAPYIYRFVLDSFFSWQYNKYVESFRREDTPKDPD